LLPGKQTGNAGRSSPAGGSLAASNMSRPFVSSNDAAAPHEIGALVSPHAANPEWLAGEMQRHEPAVRGYLRSQFPTIEADDVLQESYLKILRARAATGIVSLKAYFFSVARNTARTFFRRRQIYSTRP
jgi:hypothetical protein